MLNDDLSSLFGISKFGHMNKIDHFRKSLDNGEGNGVAPLEESGVEMVGNKMMVSGAGKGDWSIIEGVKNFLFEVYPSDSQMCRRWRDELRCLTGFRRVTLTG